MMKGFVSLGALTVLAGLLSGCMSSGAFTQDVAQLNRHVGEIEERVGRLESASSDRSPHPSSFSSSEFDEPSQEPVRRSRRSSLRYRGALIKLARGLVNAVTGWVEIPKRVHETAQRSGAGAGFTYGLLRGLGYGFIRTVGGAYEVITFPAPAPEGYRPIMEPEYVFTED